MTCNKAKSRKHKEFDDMYDRMQLTQKMRWKIADWIKEDNIEVANSTSAEVHPKNSFYVRYGKRTLDILIALPAFVITLPINLIIGLITFFDVGRPLFFKQERSGKDGEIFMIVKFRNMRNTVDERGELLPADQRVTKWGKIVRSTSLDELLNFWSILKGDMSLIGPRPLPPQYKHRCSKRHMARYTLRPGLECPPRDIHIRTRNWNEQFENDVWYVENVSFWTDCMMLVNLIRFTFDKKNSGIRGGAGRGDFMGYDKNGKAFNLASVPQFYVERAFMELNDDGTCKNILTSEILEMEVITEIASDSKEVS